MTSFTQVMPGPLNCVWERWQDLPCSTWLQAYVCTVNRCCLERLHGWVFWQLLTALPTDLTRNMRRKSDMPVKNEWSWYVNNSIRGPSIYEVHTEGIRLKWTHVDGGKGSAPCGRPHKNLSQNDVILASSCAKKLECFLQKNFFGSNEKWKFFVNINQ